MEPITEWICNDCGSDIEIRTDLLVSLADVVRVRCFDCNKDFMLGHKKDESTGEYYAYTYKLHDGQAIAPVLKELFTYVSLPLIVIDEILHHAKFNRWSKFMELVKRYREVISQNQVLSNYLEANAIFPS